MKRQNTKGIQECGKTQNYRHVIVVICLDRSNRIEYARSKLLRINGFNISIFSCFCGHALTTEYVDF